MPFPVTPETTEVLQPPVAEELDSSAPLVDCLAAQTNLASQIEIILSSSNTAQGVEAVKRIFNYLVRLLECLEPMEANLHRVRESLALFELIRDDLTALLEFTETEALQIEGMSENLYEVIDGLSFALKHEARRVFEDSALEPAADEPTEITQAKLSDAHRVLTNCLQQSVITLVQVFDPGLDGRQLFNNSKARLKQSLILCKDLWELSKIVRRAEQTDTPEAVAFVIQRVNQFRNSSMHFLMYKDWGQFDRLADELEQSAKQKLKTGQLLHTMFCYLETLLGQVRLRGVLSQVLPDVLFNAPDDQGSELEWTSDLRLSFELYMVD
ncbi:MAG: hypothetical protein ACREA9_20165 [Pyrinomonadaceae bacterium]